MEEAGEAGQAGKSGETQTVLAEFFLSLRVHLTLQLWLQLCLLQELKVPIDNELLRGKGM